MNPSRKILITLILLLCLPGISGCWNYTEVEDMSIVAGVAIDKNKPDGKILLTAETVDTQGGGQEAQSGGHATSQLTTLTGNTMFDIVRKMITKADNKLFWSHAKAIIISEEFAREGIVKVLDWYSRDTETRADVFIFISNEKNAGDVLKLSSVKKSVLSFDLGQMMDFQRHVSTFPVVDIWDFFDNLEATGRNAIAPIVYVEGEGQERNERVNGTAIFLRDKMVGTLSGEESKYMLFASNKIQGGILAVEDEKGQPAYSLEIFSNKTKVKPMWVNGRIQIQISPETHTGLDEVMTMNGFPDFERKKTIEKLAEQQLQKNMLAVIHKVQREYHSDVFGFGGIIRNSMPKAWEKLSKDWPQEFSELEVVVKPKVIVETSAKTSRSIKVGD
jgi:spore germination protein KC